MEFNDIIGIWLPHIYPVAAISGPNREAFYIARYVGAGSNLLIQEPPPIGAVEPLFGKSSSPYALAIELLLESRKYRLGCNDDGFEVLKCSRWLGCGMIYLWIVYTPDIPCMGSWSVYSRYSLYQVVECILLIFPVRGRGVGSPVRGHGVYTPNTPCMGSWSVYSRYSLYGVVELAHWLTGSELRSDALPVTTIDFFGIRTHDSLRASCIVPTKPRLLPNSSLQ